MEYSPYKEKEAKVIRERKVLIIDSNNFTFITYWKKQQTLIERCFDMVEQETTTTSKKKVCIFIFLLV